MARAWLILPAAALTVLFAARANLGPRAPFTASVHTVTAADLRWSYRPGCPVPPGRLRLLRLAYWDFDGRRRLGGLVVNAEVVRAVEQAFARLYAAHFPIRRMEPIDAYRGSDDRSMAADNTSAFNCRYAVAAGPRRWSVHAYGEAIDVNPLENPYLEGGKVLPPAGRPYLDRVDVREGMVVAGGPIVRAFAAVGWQWGGRWTGSPDYQHFSATGG
jgi:D-alanyl-D-alanine carboxypeptidase-like protein